MFRNHRLTAFALVFSRMVSAAGEIAAASLSPRAILDRWLILPLSIGLFAIACLCMFGMGKSQHAMPVLNDLVFERMRSSWLGVVSTVGFYLFVLFFVSGLVPLKLGSGSLCRETFFAEPDMQTAGNIGNCPTGDCQASVTFRSSAPTLMTMLLKVSPCRWLERVKVQVDSLSG